MPAELTVETADGKTFAAYFASTEATPAPGIIVLPPIFGVDRQMRDLVDRCAHRGYAAAVLNQFWRDPQPQEFARTPEERPLAVARAARVDVDQLVDDLDVAIAALRDRPECNGKIAVMGYCFGGRYAFLAAARLGVDAAAAFHGTQIGLALADAPNVAAPLSLHFGADDALTPPEQIDAIRLALRHRSDAEIVVYPAAVHNFSQPGWPGYDPTVAAASEERAFALFDQLKTPPVSP
ncbi:MAG: Carboxymethylenebutenolidase [Candidatus Eremiobacteraeota bacterium]|nr:Carboxymethylenebutenolidase [Candidatus Eremiobacteraeota bacterium]